MAFNIFSTLNQNLQNFWGDLYDTYQAWKSKVGNVASTINTNLQNFWGDIYDVGSTIKKNVSNFWTQTYNQGKQAVTQIQSTVSQFGTDVANKASAVKKSILAPAFRQKLAEAIAKGLPYYIDEDLNIKTLTEDQFYGENKKV